MQAKKKNGESHSGAEASGVVLRDPFPQALAEEDYVSVDVELVEDDDPLGLDEQTTKVDASTHAMLLARAGEHEAALAVLDQAADEARLLRNQARLRLVAHIVALCIPGLLATFLLCRASGVLR